MDSRELTMAILAKLKDVNDHTGEFIAGLLSDDLSAAEQIAFARRLVDVAELIRQRTTTPPIVVEGVVVDGSDARQTQRPGEG